jgi:hypothetical protein
VQQDVLRAKARAAGRRTKLRWALWLLVGAPCLAGMLAGHEVRADDPPPVDPTVVVYQPLSELQPWEPTADQVVATTESEFLALVDQCSQDPNFVGTIIITDGPAPGGAWPPCEEGSVHLWLRFRDVDYYQSTWVPAMQGGWTPGYAEGIEADPPPTLAETLFTLRLWNLEEGGERTTRMRVAKADGAIGVVQTVLKSGDPIPLEPLSSVGCDAGPYHPGCCRVQEFFCNLLCGWIRFFGWSYCDTCVQDCDDCEVDNPCHSCGWCGMTWAFRWIPGAH